MFRICGFIEVQGAQATLGSFTECWALWVGSHQAVPQSHHPCALAHVVVVVVVVVAASTRLYCLGSNCF